MDPDADPGGPKTYGSYGSGSGCGSETATLLVWKKGKLTLLFINFAVRIYEILIRIRMRIRTSD
jgi:hypothetical protein